MEEHSERNQSAANLSQEIIGLIFDGQYQKVREMIEAARLTLSSEEAHRLTALTAVLQSELGQLDESIELMRQARQESPTWLPHLYRLSVLLMDGKRWGDADTTLDELISLSEQTDDAYFIDESRFRKIICLKELGREDEIQFQKSKIAKGTAVFIGDRYCQIEDLD